MLVPSLGQEDPLEESMTTHSSMKVDKCQASLGDIGSVQFRCSVVSDSLIPQGLQHARLQLGQYADIHFG